jgi:hypothetical protein
MVVFPALAVMIAVLSFNLLGGAWRDWLDPASAPKSKPLDPPGRVFDVRKTGPKNPLGM